MRTTYNSINGSVLTRHDEPRSTYILSPLGVALQEKLVCQELLLNTTRCIEAISSHDQVFALISFSYIGNPMLDLGRLTQHVERLVVDT